MSRAKAPVAPSCPGCLAASQFATLFEHHPGVSQEESKAPNAHLHLALVVKRAAQAGRRAPRESQVFKRDEEGGREARVVGMEEAVCGGRMDGRQLGWLEQLRYDGNMSGASGVEDAACGGGADN